MGLLGGQNGLRIGVAQADQLFRQNFGEPGDESALDDQPPHGPLLVPGGGADVGGGALDLLVEEQGQLPEFFGVGLVYRPHAVLAAVGGQNFLHVADADALLHGEDYNEVGDVYPVVLPLHRSRHDLQAHIVVDGGGGDEALLAAGDGRDEAEILHQQHQEKM